MISAFPQLLDYSIVVPVIIRLALGASIIHFGYKIYKGGSVKARYTAGPLFFGGTLLIIGLFVQVVAVITAIVLILLLAKKFKSKAFFTNGVNYFAILLVLAVSLLFLGAGSLAFDLPV
jgi:hypothetical protein